MKSKPLRPPRLTASGKRVGRPIGSPNLPRYGQSRRAKYEPIESGELCAGVMARTTPRGIRVLTIRHFADPAKCGPTWLEDQAKLFLRPSDFRREIELDWTSGKGSSVYPVARDLYKMGRLVVPIPGLIRDEHNLVTVYRGWDFGLRRPACVWCQYDAKYDRLIVLREFMPEDLNTYEHRDLVLALSGQLDPALLPDRAMAFWDKLGADFTYGNNAAPPWFGSSTGRPTRFVDFAGHEALMSTALVETASVEVTHAQILGERSIFLTAWRSNRKSREEIIRKLLMTRADGYPGLLLSEYCPILQGGLVAGITYPVESERNPFPQESRKDGFYEHLHDALGYVVVNVVPSALAARPVEAAPYVPQELTRHAFQPTRPRLPRGQEIIGGFAESYDRDDWAGGSDRSRYD